MRFISGLICGLLASASILALANDDESIVAENWNRDWDYPWSSADGNPKLGNESVVPFPSPNEGDDYPYLDLVESNPLLELSRNDIKSVCIFGYSGENTPIFSTEIFLTPDARQRVADILASKDGVEVAFRWLGIEVNAFTVDARKLEYFKEFADIYPGALDWKERTSSLENEENYAYLDLADLSFSSGPSSLYMGYYITKILSGTNELEACEHGKPPHEIPGYTEHLELWTKTKEMYASGKMKRYGYDY